MTTILTASTPNTGIGFGMMPPSERKILLDQIKELQAEKKAIYSAALRHASRIINEYPHLSVQQRTDILDQIWRME